MGLGDGVAGWVSVSAAFGGGFGAGLGVVVGGFGGVNTT